MTTVCGNYIADKLLGEGTYGKIYLIHDANDPTKQYALKQTIKDQKDNIIQKEEIIEAEILLRVNHVNVLRAIELYFDPHDNICMILPLANMDLNNYIANNVYLYTDEYIAKGPSPIILKFMHDIVCGLDYLHRNFIVHNDLSPKNILIYGDTIKIADFGHSLFCNGSLIPYTGILPKLTYKAPELIEIESNPNSTVFGVLYYTNAVDIWSMGCVFLEMLSGSYAFTSDSNTQLLVDIKILVENLTPNQETLTQTEFQKLKIRLGDRFDRTIKEARNSRFKTLPQEWIKFILYILNPNPYSRPSAIDILKNPVFNNIHCSKEYLDIDFIPDTSQYTTVYTPKVRSLFVANIRSNLNDMLNKSMFNNLLLQAINILDRYMSLSPKIDDFNELIPAALMLSQYIIFGRIYVNYFYKDTYRYMIDIIKKLNFRLYTKPPIDSVIDRITSNINVAY